MGRYGLRFRRAMGAVTLMAVVILGGSFASTLAAPLDQAQGQGVQKDVTYCTAGGVALKMDIYKPQGAASSALPAAMYIHGGGWTSGSKNGVGPEATELLARGYIVASIDYRLAPQYQFPAQIEDAKCAVRYLRANASTLGLDPNRIVAWGGSAGGHLVSLLGLADASAGFEGNSGYPEQSSRVAAVVDFFGPSDLNTLNGQPQTQERVFGTGPDALSKASPVNYITKDDPPFLIAHGDKDAVVPLSQSQELYDRLTAAGVPATFVIVKNAGHGFSGSDISPSRTEIARIVGDFFDKQIGNTPPARSSVVASTPVQRGTQQPQPTRNPRGTPGVTGTPVKPNASMTPGAGQNGEVRLFPETGKRVRGPFLAYWDAHGGLAQQGFPISEEMQEKSDTDGKVYRVQYFERAVFEYHPENKAPYDLLLSLLGAFQYRQKYADSAPAQTPNNSSGSVVFKETGKRVGGKFLAYWQKNGGIMQQGLPISDEFNERSALDGKEYTVQYFERARFELHPENAGTPYEVLLSQLGTFRYAAKYAAGGGNPGNGSNKTPLPSTTPRTGSTPNPTSQPGGGAGPNCERTSVGSIPLTDLGMGQYKGFEGGLYPGGQNTLSGAYKQEGMSRAAAIKPLNKDGQPDANGKVVLLSLGMSNTTQEFSAFKRAADADPQKSAQLMVVDGAQGGQDATDIEKPNAQFWANIEGRLTQAGVSAKQVQVIWLKEAIARETRPFPADAEGLRDSLRAIVGIVQQRYPNAQIVYLASRTYAGYATTDLNPEPYAYESGFAVKWVIEERISGKLSGPWLAWGPYLWTDGTKGRSDGLVWTCADVESDGTHPSASGEKKVADLLLSFFKSDDTAKPWFAR